MNTLPLPVDDFQKQILHGVFRRGWRMTGFALMGFVHTWILTLWVLQMVIHPGILLAFGILFALVIGLWLGSGARQEESEEMLFSLPPTRGQLFWAQAALGGLPLLLLSTLGVWALRVEAPQVLWGLFVTSGFTGPFRLEHVTLLWPWSVSIPALLFACLYGFSALTVNRSGVFLALVLGVLVTGGMILGGAALESALWERPRGDLSAALMFAAAALILWGCGRKYQQKEGHPGPATTKAGPGGIIALILVIIVAVFILMSFYWLQASTSVDFEPPPETRLQEEPLRSIPPSPSAGE
ncbi:MAG: hypothetical protein JJU05_12770 [Verrucomicrobia bacterium]|nr:hypothetical protein [Verrucomicrobiota bacterium]MCH8529152.1 hypothetical protein [Kiritimatiellia bacterium]